MVADVDESALSCIFCQANMMASYCPIQSPCIHQFIGYRTTEKHPLPTSINHRLPFCCHSLSLSIVQCFGGLLIRCGCVACLFHLVARMKLSVRFSNLRSQCPLPFASNLENLLFTQWQRRASVSDSGILV